MEKCLAAHAIHRKCDLMQSESQLQESFIDLLKDNGYEYVEITSEDDLLANFKKQLKSFNKCDFNFNEVLNYLYSGDKNSKFDKLRKSFKGIRFVDFSDFSSNIFQVAEEVSMVGHFQNRYDVTILINGLPLIQIELKKSGVELMAAFGQIQRYLNHSYSGLFDLTQLFVISNKVNTKYFFNDFYLDYNFTYNWKDNHDLESFTKSFFDKETLMTVLSDYIFKDHFTKNYILLRDYQIEALNSVLDKIKSNENGYVWLSSNTGKSTVSLRLSELLSDKYQVIYVTNDELSTYPEEVTAKSIKEFLALIGNNLIITNIRYILALKEDLDLISDREFIFIFNDYDKHSMRYNPQNIVNKFKNSLFYCFTSAPIFDENIVGDKTTKSVFTNRIYDYSFKDALEDKTNLPISIDYVNDREVSEDYDLSSNLRIEKISKYILSSSSKAILIVKDNNDLIRYYNFLKESHFNIVPVLRHDANDIFESEPVRDYFEMFIEEYNINFNSQITNRKVINTRHISIEFERDVIKRFNNGEIDLLIIDEAMFTYPFRQNILGNLNNSLLNTVYLDCNLEYDLLFKALTLSNQPDDNGKLQGNIVTFRDLRRNIDEAVKLFSDNNASENIVFRDYDYYSNKYNECLSEIADFEKIKYYYDILTTFDEFDFDKSQIDEFNSLKDKFENQKFTDNLNKKVITDFNPETIDHFTIDLNYLTNDNGQTEDDESQKIYTNSFFIDNSIKNENFLSLTNVDNSKQLNVLNNNQDLSKTVYVTIEFHIHMDGDSINSNNLDLKNLIETKVITDNEDEYVKICPRCREKYIERFNFCPKHEDGINLVFISELIKKCSCCGLTYPKNYNYCPKCGGGKPLTIDVKLINTHPNKYYGFNDYSNDFEEITILLTENNIHNLKNFNFSQMQFDTIINNIKKTYKTIFDYLIEEYNIDLDTLTTINKILLFSKSFVITDFKEGGGDFGHFEFNEIYIDDRASDALQITTLIHELSHFLLAEILEQIVSELLNTNKTDAVEAFVCYLLVKNNLNALIDEYCAHTVEGRFAPLGYQDYGSYERCLSDCLNEYTEKHIEIANMIGNTFAHYIKNIMSSFIDEKIRDEIKDEFNKINDLPKYSGLKYETDGLLEWEGFSSAIKIMLTGNLDDFKDNPQDMEKLELYAVKFKEVNKG